MCTPWTHQRLARCRVRDWALNFLACGIHLDPERCYQPTKVSILKRHIKKKRPMQNGVQVKESEQAAAAAAAAAAAVSDSAARNNSNVDSEDSCWPHFSDEDYIVFCFREDGAFDIVKDDQDDSDEIVFPRNSQVSCSTRRVENHKLSDGNEVEVERFYDESQELIAREDDCIVKKLTSGRRPIVAKKEVEAEEGLKLDAKKGADQVESEDSGMVSAESNGSSNQSDTSTSSFAFPVMSWEWSGSPVEMPKSSRGVQLRKHRARLHCCRF